MTSKIQQMISAGIPVSPSGSDEAQGLYVFGAMTEEQMALLGDILNPPGYETLRKREYDKRGCTIEALTVLLWEEKTGQDVTDKISSIQADREAIKLMFPKA